MVDPRDAPPSYYDFFTHFHVTPETHRAILPEHGDAVRFLGTPGGDTDTDTGGDPRKPGSFKGWCPYVSMGGS